MKKKYILTEETIEVKGKTLYRIKAIKDFGDVKSGDLGGYIENEENLSHEGNCWIYKNSKVYGFAKIYDNAKIFDYAKVYGFSKIYDNAKIYDKARIYNSEIFDFAKVYGNAKIYEYSKVYGNAKICGNAVIEESQIYDFAHVCGSSRIYRNSKIYGTSYIFEKTLIEDYSEVYGNAKIFGHSIIYNSKIYDDAQIYGFTKIEKSKVYGSAKIYDNAKVSYDSEIYDNAQIYEGASVNFTVVNNDLKVYGDTSLYGTFKETQKPMITVEKLLQYFNNPEMMYYSLYKNKYIAVICLQKYVICLLDNKQIPFKRGTHLFCTVENLGEKITTEHIKNMCILPTIDDKFLHGYDSISQNVLTTYAYQSKLKNFDKSEGDIVYYYYTHGDDNFSPTILRIDSNIPDKKRYVLGTTEYYKNVYDIIHHTHIYGPYNTISNLFEDCNLKQYGEFETYCFIDIPKYNFYIRNNNGEIVYECNTQKEVDEFMSKSFTIESLND